MIGRNYLIISIFPKMNFSVCITVYGTLDTMLAGRGRRNLLFRLRTCTLEPPGRENRRAAHRISAPFVSHFDHPKSVNAEIVEM